MNLDWETRKLLTSTLKQMYAVKALVERKSDDGRSVWRIVSE